VPAGNAALSASSALSSGLNCPMTLETMCMTWEYRSISMFSVNCTLPIWLTRPTSFLPKSISIRCSARSLGSASNSCSSDKSSASSRPRGRVPAMGRTVIFCSSKRTKISGDEPTI